MDISFERKELRNHLELTTNTIHEMIHNDFPQYSLSIHEADANYYQILVKEKDQVKFKLKIIQIIKAIKIILYELETGRSWGLVLSLEKFFRPMLRNSILIDKTRRFEDYFLKGRHQKFGDLLKCRITNRMKEQHEEKSIMKLSKNEIVNVCKYLKKKDIFNLLRTNSFFYTKYFSDNNFWMTLYHTRFKKTGFKIDQINWKTAFLNKA